MAGVEEVSMTRAELIAEYERLQQKNTALKAKQKYLEAENQWLKEQFKLARHRRFGASSEKTSAIVQTELVFNEVEVTLDSTPIEPEPRTITYARKPKQAGHREKMLADLPVEVIEAASIRLRSWTVSRDICTPVPEYFGADRKMSSLLKQPPHLITEQFECLALGRRRVNPDGLW